MQGRKNIFFLYPSKFLAGAPVIKDSLIREKSTHIYLVELLQDTKAFIRKWRPKATVKPTFYVRCEECRVVKNVIGPKKGYELSVVNQETAYSFKFHVPLFRNKDAPFPWV